MGLESRNAQLVDVITCEPSVTASTADLLSVSYMRAQKDSPEYNTVYEGIDQSVDVQISTIVLHAAPEPIISLYDFIMTTFVSNANRALLDSPSPPPASDDVHSSADDSKIRVVVKLESVRGP